MSMMWTTRLKFPVLILLLQVVFIVLFATTVEYGDSATPPRHNSTGHKDNLDPVVQYYPMFQDVHVMIFIGFGFLMTFLKRYGYSSVGLNFFIASLVLQWATLVLGYVHGDGTVKLDMQTMLTADFAAAAVLITFGAVLGKVSASQLICIALIEVIVFALNEWIGISILKVSDIGGSMFVHAFGAYFGLALARVLYVSDIKESDKEGSVYHSDMFAMIGTIFLWLFWPSFNSALAEDEARNRAVLNTYFALAACCIVSFAISVMTDRGGKIDMVHVQNATLAGGVAVGTTADMMIHPYGALIIGTAAGILSTLGYKYITPCLNTKLKIHDTCGVNNLHGMPAVLAGIAGAVVSALATEEVYGTSLYTIFSARAPITVKAMSNSTGLPLEHIKLGRTASEQAGCQALALIVTIGMAVAGGFITGIIVKKLSLLGRPRGEYLFEDGYMWNLPEKETEFDWTRNKDDDMIELKSEARNAKAKDGKRTCDALLADSDDASPAQDSMDEKKMESDAGADNVDEASTVVWTESVAETKNK